MTGSTIADIILGGVLITFLLWMFRHIVSKMDQSIQALVAKQDGFAAKLDEFGTKLNEFGTKLNEFGTRLNEFGTRLNVLSTKQDTFADKQDELVIRQSEHNERLAVVETELKAHRVETRQFRADVNQRFTDVNQRFTDVYKNLDRVDKRLDRIDSKMDAGFTLLNNKIDTGLAEVRELLFKFFIPTKPMAQPPSSPALTSEEIRKTPEHPVQNASHPSSSPETSKPQNELSATQAGVSIYPDEPPVEEKQLDKELQPN